MTYRWSLGPALRGADGAAPPSAFEATFRTTGLATGVSVPAGFVVDRVVQQGTRAPEALLPAPWLGAGAFLAGDASWDRLFTLTDGGDLGSLLSDSRWTRPEGLARGGDGTLIVCDASGLYRVDARRMVTLQLAGSATTRAGAVAWAGGAFGDFVYLCDPSGNRVSRLGAGGSPVTFAGSINGPEGLAFGPGGPWGTDLYVSDANLGSVSSSTNGAGRIVRLSSAGAATTLVTDPGLLNGASALAFDPVGRLGGDLFVADILSERILRVTPGGLVTVFATGFGNLSGSQCLAFGADGALYVADAGSAQSFSNTSGSNEAARVLRIAAAGLTLDAPGAAGAVRAALAPPSPHPVRGGATLRFTLPRAGRAMLVLFDVAGRRVRTLADGTRAAGEHAVAWDGRDDAGARLRAGVYFARLEHDGAAATRRLVVLE
jgi:hypothetical protein